MGKITSIGGLEAKIEALKVEQELKGQLLREEFLIVSESLKPINLLKSTFREGTSSLNLVDGIIGTVVGVAAGSLSRKIFVGASANVFRRLMGTAIQFSITSIVGRNTNAIKSAGKFITQRIFHRNRSNSE
jgi:hypothetical protein